MKLLTILMLLLVLAFSFTLSYYLTAYKMKGNILVKSITFVVLTSLNTFITLVFCSLALWPAP